MRASRPIIFMTLLLAAALPAAAQRADAIVGVWLTESGKGHVQIYEQGDRYFGKIVWLREPSEADGKPKLDTQNPDVRKRIQPILGLINLRGFTHNGENVWEDGEVYDPESGKDYSCKLTLKSNNTLEVRGFIGISLLGRTETWKRVR